MPNPEYEEEYRIARAEVIFAARDRLQAILGHELSLMEQRYVRDIAFGVFPWAIDQRVKFPGMSDLSTIHPVQETVARYMRDVMSVSIEELFELKRVFGKDVVRRRLAQYHEAIHRP